jgi:hypothetical protein
MKNPLVIILIFCLYEPAYSLDINQGQAVNDSNLSALAYGDMNYAVADLLLQDSDQGVVKGYYRVQNQSDLYSISSGLNLYHMDFDNRKLISSWPLTRWPYQYYSPDVKTQYEGLFSTGYPLPFEYESVAPGPGCIGSAPLRYGDIDGDDKSEVVVILGGLFIIFSPEHGRTVFAEYLDESDWYTTEQAAKLLRGQEPLTNVQYMSRLWADNSNGRVAGIRAYAKLFFGDFDQDGNPDILAWRKSYRSNSGNDPVKGFTKMRENLQHFERDLKAQEESPQGITGEYLPQATDETTIKEWLTTANLTWQKGYPDKSECPGEEGKPIPEMSDPLLNDPEVMQ